MFGELVVSFEAAATTFLALYAGLFTPIFVMEKSERRLTLLIALASGVMFWSFLDLMDDATLLGVNQGFSGGLSHVLIAALFAATVVALFWLDAKFQRTRRRRETSLVTFTYVTVILVAVGIGAHSFGEGVEIGSLIGYSFLSAPLSVNIIEAIGGIGAGAAYLMHKFLEGLVIGVFAAAAKTSLTRNVVLGLLAGVPTVLGLSTALIIPVDATVFFGIGAGAVFFIEYKLIPSVVRRDGVMIYVLVCLVGFYLMYLAALFHSYATIF